MSLTNCRFYEEKYPEIDSFVMVNVRQVRHAPCPRLSHALHGGGRRESEHARQKKCQQRDFVETARNNAPMD